MHESITCGHTSPDEEEEAIAEAARQELGSPNDGCGRDGEWVDMYRCAECHRFYHHDCLINHFRISGDDAKTTRKVFE